jgi:putative transposase
LEFCHIVHGDFTPMLAKHSNRTGISGRIVAHSYNRPETGLMIDVLRAYVAVGKFRLHGFVIMPNDVHLLITVGAETTIEKAMQYVKGGLSYRLKKEYGSVGEVWQRGFAEVRVENRESFLQHREYIAANPVEAGLVDSPEEFPYCFSYLARKKAAGAEAPQGLLDRHD